MSAVDLGEAEFLTGVQALLPRGAAWPRDPDARLTGLLSGIAATQARQHARTGALSERESDPSQADELLAAWEASYGLPDACAPADATIASRRAALLARIAEQRSPTPAAFIALAAALGVDATIIEHQAHTTEHDTEDAVTDETWAFVWDMLSPEILRLELTTEDTTETPLEVWQTGAHECAVRRMAPAHTLVRLGVYQAEWGFAGGVPAGASLLRASPATHTDYRGQLVEAAADVARYDYDPGLEYNLVAQPWLGAAVSGLPEGWAEVQRAEHYAPSTVLGVGADGIPYADVTFVGTPANTIAYAVVFQPNEVPASSGMQFVADIGACILPGGSMNTTRVLVGVHEMNNNATIGGALTETDAAIGTTPVRIRVSRTLNNAGTNNVRVGLRVGYMQAGAAANFTVRITFPVLNVGLTYLTDTIPLATLAERIDGIPQYGLRGLAYEPRRTNHVSNPRMEGVTVGTSAAPTGMAFFGAAELAREVVAIGVEDGLPFIDVRWWGTLSVAVAFGLQFNSPAASYPAAAPGETWTGGFHAALIAGSVGTLSSTICAVFENAAGGGALLAGTDAITLAPGLLRRARHRHTRTLVHADTAKLHHQLRMVAPAGTHDLTLRIAGPQLEPGAFASSLILPPPAAPAVTTREADALILPVADGHYACGLDFRTVSEAGTIYGAPALAILGEGLRVPLPPAAIAAGERHLKFITLRRTA